MKTYYYINLIILFLTINIFAQNKDIEPEVSPLLNESFKFNNFSDQIIVISIINPNNSKEISKRLDKLLLAKPEQGALDIAEKSYQYDYHEGRLSLRASYHKVE